MELCQGMLVHRDLSLHGSWGSNKSIRTTAGDFRGPYCTETYCITAALGMIDVPLQVPGDRCNHTWVPHVDDIDKGFVLWVPHMGDIDSCLYHDIIR